MPNPTPTSTPIVVSMSFSPASSNCCVFLRRPIYTGGWVLPQPDGSGDVRPRQGGGRQGRSAVGVGLLQGTRTILYAVVWQAARCSAETCCCCCCTTLSGRPVFRLRSPPHAASIVAHPDLSRSPVRSTGPPTTNLGSPLNSESAVPKTATTRTRLVLSVSSQVDNARCSFCPFVCFCSWQGAPPKPLVKDVFASERRKAKTLNFSIAYGKVKMTSGGTMRA